MERHMLRRVTGRPEDG
jgi:hypothetical protein